MQPLQVLALVAQRVEHVTPDSHQGAGRGTVRPMPAHGPAQQRRGAAEQHQQQELRDRLEERSGVKSQLRRAVQRQHPYINHHYQEGHAQQQCQGPFQDHLGARHAVGEREFKQASILVLADGRRPGADGHGRGEHESQQAEEGRLGVAGAGRDLVVVQRPDQLLGQGGEQFLHFRAGHGRVERKVQRQHGHKHQCPDERGTPGVKQRLAHQRQDGAAGGGRHGRGSPARWRPLPGGEP